MKSPSFRKKKNHSQLFTPGGQLGVVEVLSVANNVWTATN
jgi:hypothetical protein